MDGKSRSSVELLVAYVALEMFGLLMVDEHLVIIKLSVAVPGPGSRNLLVVFYIVPTTHQTSKRPYTGKVQSRIGGRDSIKTTGIILRTVEH